MRDVLKRAAALALALALWGAAAPAQDFRDYGVLGRPADQSGPSVQDYGRLAETMRSGAALDATHQRVSQFQQGLTATLARGPEVGADVARTLERASPGGGATYFLGLGAFLVILVGIGRAVATLFGVYVGRPVFVGMQRRRPEGLADKLAVLAVRMALAVVAVILTLATATLVGAGFYPDEDAVAVRTALVAFAGYATLRLVDTFWRTLLAPYLREFRLPALDDRAARKLFRWLYAVTLYEVVTSGGLYWLDALGLHDRASALLHIAQAGIAAALVAAGALANRGAITSALLGGVPARSASWPALAGAALWGPALAAYLAGTFATLVWRAVIGAPLGAPPLATAFLVLAMALICYAAVVFVVERVARRRREAGSAEIAAQAPPARPAPRPSDDAPAPAPERDLRADGGPIGGDDEEGGGPAPRQPAAVLASRSGMRSFEDLARRVASFFALGAALWTLVWLWGGASAFDEGQPLDVAQDVADILFMGYVAYHALRIWIDQRIEAEGAYDVEVEPGDEGGASAASRLATLLPLVRNFLLSVIAASIGLFVAMELGVNVAPLLGGAGIVGLAIGFGSQTLVRDILSGAFYLFDDAFRKGEYIDVGEVKGTVERISLRSFQLRHHLGALHTIPFGEIRHLTNYSRDWVMMKLPLRLTYDTDPERVRKIIKKIGLELLDHPEEGYKFLQPLKSQGVYMMEDSAMIIRVKYMTRPGDQWTTRKLVYATIRDAFAREGIKFAHREVTVRLPDLEPGRGLTEAEAQGVGAAARRAVDDADAQRALRPVAVGDDR